MSIAHSMSSRDETAAALRGHVSEMFCSIQGEGLFLGERQIFVRTAGCAATCSWCDTVYSKVRTPRFVIHAAAPGSNRPWRENPVALADLLEDVRTLARANEPVRSISITGGEPLEQPAFVRELAGALRADGFRIHLETAGLHAETLASLIGSVDVIAADVKLASATGVDHADAHRAFLAVMVAAGFDAHRPGGRSAFVKVVVDTAASAEEIEQAALLVAGASRALPFVIQPESGALFGRHSTRESRAALLALVETGARVAGRHLDDVRVIPQTHKVLHIR